MNLTSKKLFGFTLAELMVVLAVLGVIAAILLPTIFHAMPDENRLKFKKGFYTLKRTIDSMVNSEAYSAYGGKFGVLITDPENKPSNMPDPKNFCVQFSETLNTTYAQCDDSPLPTISNGAEGYKITDITPTDDEAKLLDTSCAAMDSSDVTQAGKRPNMVTQDGINWGVQFDDFSTNSRTTKNNVVAHYAIVCMDVDGKGDTPPFGFGVRYDGKVIVGYNAKLWLQEGANNVFAPTE